MKFKPMLPRSSGILFAFSLAAGAQAQALLDTLDDSLLLQSPNGVFRSDLSVLVDLETYYIDQQPMGLLFPDDEFFFNPRLSLFLDTKLGDHLYSLVQVRFDRGFDPGSDRDGDARFDEYLLRYTPWDAPLLNVQVGKFATLTGNWVGRHDSWDNPFINAPLPYENVLAMTDRTAPGSVTAFHNRRNRPDQKSDWVPIIWGPAYTTGAALFGRVEQFDYAFEVKNRGLSSRPAVWDGTDYGFEDPTVSGRIGTRPNAAWNIGANASYGPYMLRSSRGSLPPGTEPEDFNQLTVGPDVSFAWHHWQFWAEAYASRFEVPRVGNAETVAYYLETKYKITSQLFASLRWNQQLFDKVRDASGVDRRWDRDIWRAETALGFRFNRHWQAKIQYSYSHENGPSQQGEQLVATQLTLKF